MLQDRKGEYPRKILCLTEFSPTDNENQQRSLNRFIGFLEDFLRVDRTVFSIRERWAKNCPKTAQGRCSDDYLKDVNQ